MDDVPLCPPWWPRIVWDLHVIKRPGVGPINYPPAIDDMMASLTMHTMSYLLMDQDEGAQAMRNMAQERLVKTANRLTELHNRAAGE
jgi:hypothetical protein